MIKCQSEMLEWRPGIPSQSSHTNDITADVDQTPGVSASCAWHDCSVLGVVEIVVLMCKFISVWQHVTLSLRCIFDPYEYYMHLCNESCLSGWLAVMCCKTI